MKPAAEKVQAAIAASGLRGKVIELDVHARTSQQAAEALGVAVGQIAKSLVFTVDGRPLLVIASGANRVDEAKLGALAEGVVRRADANAVRQATGYAIGGVPPFGHTRRLDTYLDRDLLEFDQVWAAAGRPDTVFPIDPRELQRITDARVAEVVEAT